MDRRIGDRGLALIKEMEGLRLELYEDAAGLPTIGYGHLVKPGEPWLERKRCTPEEAEALLRADLVEAENAVNRLVTVPLRQSQFDALVSFVYNVGADAFEKSTLLRLLNDRQSELTVAGEFPRWRHARGRPLRGLLRRRFLAAALFLAD